MMDTAVQRVIRIVGAYKMVVECADKIVYEKHPDQKLIDEYTNHKKELKLILKKEKIK